MVKNRAHKTPGRNEVCPCGSGKKYKQCCALRKNRSWASQSWGKVIIGLVGFSLAILIGYSIAKMDSGESGPTRSNSRTLQSTPYYTDRSMPEVDFTALNADQKKTVLENINAEYCICGCSLTLAQCVVTDSTCPIRNGNIAKIQSKVNEAAGS